LRPENTAGPSAPLRSGRDDNASAHENVHEAELVARARLGDQEAFSQLYQLHNGYVRGIGRNILRDDSVDDLCQDTFLLAFTRLDSFEGSARFRTWLTRIAINRCMAMLRKRRYVVPLEEADDALNRCFYATTDAGLEGAPARMDLEKMMSLLTPARRQVLKMAYLDGVPDLEIAAALGISVAAVKTRLYQAKRKMRRFYS
jgi:RNA polymerase sigma-70 factor (ECF subfamily)